MGTPHPVGRTALPQADDDKSVKQRINLIDIYSGIP
jgi:hypothetical protein